MAEVAGSSRFPRDFRLFFLFFIFFYFKYGFLFRWDFGEQWAVVAWVFLGFCSARFLWVDHWLQLV